MQAITMKIMLTIYFLSAKDFFIGNPCEFSECKITKINGYFMERLCVEGIEKIFFLINYFFSLNGNCNIFFKKYSRTLAFIEI